MSEARHPGTKRRATDLEQGSRIERYRIEEIVGRGGMGTVYRAFDTETQRDVAIKILDPGLPPTLRRRFLTECEAEARIRHTNVMAVYDQGVLGDDRPWFTMELVYEPITLTEIVEADQQGRLASTWPRLRMWSSPARLVQDVFIPIARGVDAANRRYGYLHRDLKPDNVLVDVRTRRAYLIDFGICHQKDDEVERGKIIGTPRFLSPEQAHGQVDRRTDVWGLGGLLFYILSGRPPLKGSSSMRGAERAERLKALAHAAARAKEAGDKERVAELEARRRALADPELRTMDDMLRDAREGRYDTLPETVPAAARAVVRKAMAHDPADRYENVGDLADDLEAWIQGGTVRALTETDARTAAVVAARRTLRRHVATALFVLGGLLVALPVGARLLGPDDGRAEARVAGLDEDLDALATAIDDLGASQAGSRAQALRWEALRRRHAHLEAVVAALPPEAASSREERLDDLAARMAPREVRVRGGGTEPWVAVPLLAGRSAVALEDGQAALAPGPWRLRPASGVGMEIPLEVPVAVDGTRDVLEIVVEVPPSRVPVGMMLVPASAEAPAILMGIEEVTNLEYAEWLDEIDDDDERTARVPPEGFAPDPARPGRFLADRALEDRPVRGVRPEDALAYAAWRTRIWGATHRLPRLEEWRRTIALPADGEDLFGEPLAGRDGRLLRDRSPHGVRGLLTTPPEYVLVDGAPAVVGETPGLGLPREAASLERVRPVEERVPEAGFRLVRELP